MEAGIRMVSLSCSHKSPQTEQLKNNRNLLSPSSGGQESRITMSEGLSPSVSYEEAVPGLSPGFWWWPAILTFLDLQTHHSCLCLHHHMLVCLHVHISSSYKDADCVELGASMIRAF